MAYSITVDKKFILDYPTAGKFVRMRNGSGAARSPGEVVILDTTVARGDTFTTTTSQDDAKIIGVVAEYIPSLMEGLIQVEGYLASENLYVDGTTDIAAGDLLSTFTGAGIAAKATAGKAGAFAYALAAYTTNDSAGRIKAVLIPAGRQDASATVTYGTAGQMAADGVAAANAAGTTAATARIDHVHTNTADTPALTLGTANSAGTAGSILAADSTILAFDATVPSAVQPDGSASAGSATVAARRDHTHSTTSAVPVDGSLAAANAEGTSTGFARDDHAHRAVVLDDVEFEFGTGYDATIGWETGDASNHAFVIGTGASEAVHIAQKADIGTDWNVAAYTDPTLVVHSATTPATDYIRVSHDATTATVGVVGGNLAFDVVGATTIENNVDATSQSGLVIRSDNATRADNDEISLDYAADDDGGNQTTFAKITGRITDVTDTTEDGRLAFLAMQAGTLRNFLYLGSTAAGVLSSEFNPDNLDMDFAVRANTLANMIVMDSNNATLSIGAATNVDRFVLVAPNARTATAATNFFGFSVAPAGTVTIPAGTTAVVASANFSEPNITATGTVTAAATVYIADAPTEGASGVNYGLFVDAGGARLDGGIKDANGNELVLFGETASAVNEVTITNAATGGDPDVSVTGGDAAINLALTPKSTGVVNFNYASIALGAGGSATLGTVGGSGPAATAQNAWMKVEIAGTASYIPFWR